MKQFDFPEKFKEYNGFLSSEGKYFSNDEFHALSIGVITGAFGGVWHFSGIFALVMSGKKLNGHLYDMKKEFAYTCGGFGFVETIQIVTPYITKVLGV